METVVTKLLHDFVYNSNVDSYLRINQTRREFLKLLIEAKLPFEPEDFRTITDKYKAGYWFGVSQNGKHNGEGLYATACIYNKSAAVSYERCFERIPFILEGKRVYEGFHFRSVAPENQGYCKVTGWDDTNKVLTVVSYEKSEFQRREDKEDAKKKLLSFEKWEWLKERENFIIE